MDTTQASSSLPRRLPRHPKAASHPTKIVNEHIPLAPNVSYFVEDNIEAPAPLEPGVSVTPFARTETKEKNDPDCADIVQSMQIADSALREQNPSEDASRNDLKAGYARLSVPSRLRPSQPLGFSSAARPSRDVPASRNAGNRKASDTRETTLTRVSAGHHGSAAIPRTPQGETQSIASLRSKGTSRRVTRKRKVPAGIALIVLSCVLVAYSFTIGSIENQVDRLIANSESMPAFAKSMLPWLPLLPLILLLGIVLWIPAGMIGLRRAKQRVATLATSSEEAVQKVETKRRKAPLERFRGEAEKEGIDKDAAYRAWRLLQRYGPDSHILSIYDDLHATLSMTQQQIQDVYQQLAPSAGKTVSARSVLDLMRLANSLQRSNAQHQK
jgi:hypothetical protein